MRRPKIYTFTILAAVFSAITFLVLWSRICVGVACFDRFKASEGSFYIAGRFCVADTDYPFLIWPEVSGNPRLWVVELFVSQAYMLHGQPTLVLHRKTDNSISITTKLRLADADDRETYCGEEAVVNFRPRGGPY